jgi:drug/metabolite transporter (DMT)-like permease
VSGDFPDMSCTCEAVPAADQSAMRWSTHRILLSPARPSMAAFAKALAPGGTNNDTATRLCGHPQAWPLSTAIVIPAPAVRLANLAPALSAALSFSATDILLKVVYASGMDVLTLVTLRGLLVVAFFWTWLRLAPPARWHTARERVVALGLGVLFAMTMFGLLQAIALLPVSIAILAYFIYPLLTGIAAAVTGVERLGWRALLTAAVAFLGLALMLGQQIGDLSVLGLGFAFGAALCRVVSLLATRAMLSGTDARVTTWYSMVPSTILFVAGSLAVGDWQMPQTTRGWAAFAGVTLTSTLSTLLIYISTNIVGAFRTALMMNLEPLVTLIFSMLLLEELLTPMQMVGAAAMIASLCAFQFVRPM